MNDDRIKPPAAKLSDLMDPCDFDSGDYITRFDRETGRIVIVEQSLLSAVEEGREEELGDFAAQQKEELELARAIFEDDRERFIAPPSHFDFHEYRQMERFIGSVANAAAAEQLWQAIKGKGAFHRFKSAAHRLGLLDEWYRYRLDAMKEFVIAWAEENEVPYEDDLNARKP
jgi:hypothetical protein